MKISLHDKTSYVVIDPRKGVGPYSFGAHWSMTISNCDKVLFKRGPRVINSKARVSFVPRGIMQIT